MKNTEYKLARWESKSGKYWVDLFYNPSFQYADGTTGIDAHYHGVGCGGGLSAASPEDAMRQMQARVDSGHFQPDANKTPMRLVLNAA